MCSSLYKQGELIISRGYNPPPTPSRLSDRRERHVTETGNLGYARSRQMVYFAKPSLYVYPGLHHCRDAWAKHKDLDFYEAKWLYVDALLKVCSPRKATCIGN